jgi:WD40 repeat protein
METGLPSQSSQPQPTTPGATEYRYAAFISYRHVEPDRTWAKWLHSAIETYRVPKRLARQRGILGAPGRCFRDEEELAASDDLGRDIEQALFESRFLVVICSPRIVVSRWCNREVERFREMGRGDHILALLVEGEPQDSFPPALVAIRRTVVDGQGMTREQIEEFEPLAADVRPIPHESIRQIRRLAKLRVLAQLLGVRFDDLRQREQERRTRRLAVASAMLATVLLAMTMLAGFAVYQQRRAEKQSEIATEQKLVAQRETKIADAERRRAEEKTRLAELGEMAVNEKGGRESLLRGDSEAALPPLVRAYRLADELKEDSSALRFLLTQAQIPSEGLTATFAGHTGDVTAARFSPDQKTLLTDSDDNTSRLRDRQGKLLGAIQNSRYPGRNTRFGVDRSFRHLLHLGGSISKERVEVSDRDAPGKVVAFDCPADFAAISPDGQRVVATDSVSGVQIWDAATGKLLFTFERATGLNWSVFSADGSRIFSMGSQNFVIWDALNGKKVATVPLPRNALCSFVFSPTGAAAAILANQQQVLLWTGEQVKVLGAAAKDGSESSAAFSPDGKWLLIAGDQESSLWDSRSGERQAALPHAVGPFNRDGTFSADSRRLITGGATGNTLVWELGKPEPIATVEPNQFGIRSLACSSDGQHVAACLDSAAHVWDVSAGQLLCSIPTFHGSMASFSPDGEELLVADSAGLVHEWHWKGVRSPLLLELQHGKQTVINAAAFDSSGNRVVTGGLDATAILWDAHNGKSLQVLMGHAAEITSVSFSRDGAKLLTGSMDGTAKLWEAQNGRCLTTLDWRKELIKGPQRIVVAFSPTADLMALASSEEGAAVQIGSLDGQIKPLAPTPPVRELIFSPDGKCLAVCCYNGAAFLIDAADGRRVSELKSNRGGTQQMRFSRDSQRAVTAGSDGAARLWEVGTGKLLLALPGDPRNPTALRAAAFSPDGHKVVTGADDGSALLWDAVTGKSLRAMKKPVIQEKTTDMRLEMPDLGVSGSAAPKAIVAAQFNADGTLIVTAGRDHSINVWSGIDGSFLSAFVGHTHEMTVASFDPAGQRLLSAAADSVARIWDVRLETRTPQRLTAELAARGISIVPPAHE